MSDDIIIRRLTEQDFEQSLALSQFAFQYALNAEERAWAESRFMPHEELGAFQGDRLLSKVHAIEFHAWITGRSVPMGGIASVSTWPEHRRRGLIARLLTTALHDLRRDGHAWSFLYPFSHDFYRRFGWEASAHRQRATLNRADWPKPSAPAGTWSRHAPDDRAAARRVYDRFAPRWNGMLDRDDHRWTARLARPGRAPQLSVYRDANGDARAYLAYDVRDREIRVEDHAWLDEDARRAFWHLIAQHDSMAERVTWDAAADDPVLLDHPRARVEAQATFMARVVDVRAALEQHAWQPGDPLDLTISVRDDHAPWNDAAHRVRVSADGRATTDTAADDAPADIECPVTALAPLLLGYASAATLADRGDLRGDAAALAALSARLNPRTTHLTDFF